MLVQIDIEACTDVVARLREVANEAEHRHAVVRSAAVHARCATGALAPVPALAAQLRDLAKGLLRRVDLAIEIDAARVGGSHGPVVTFEVVGDSEDTTVVALLLGQTLAAELAGWSTGEEVLVRLSEALERYSGDPDVVAGLVTTLGAQGVEDLTRRVLDAWSWDTAGLNILQPDRPDCRETFARAMGLVLASAVRAPATARWTGVDDLAKSWLGLLPGDDVGAAGARALLGGVDAAHHESLLSAVPVAATLLMRPHGLGPRFAALERAADAGGGVITVARVRAAFASLSLADRALLVATEPWLIGNLDGAPFADRIAANRVAVRAALVEAQSRLAVESLPADERATAQEQVELYGTWLNASISAYDATGRKIDLTGHQVALFDPAAGRFAEVVGTLGPGTANVGLLVGGTGTNLSSMSGQYGRARDLVDQGKGTLAVVTYLGGPMPQSIPQAADSRYANAGAARLRDFAAGLDGPAGTTLTVAGHSYGGSLVGAAEREGMIVDRVLHIESAGAGPGVASSADYAAPETPRYSMTAPDDFINLAQGTGFPDPVHGADPDLVDGTVRLETGWLEDADHTQGLISGFTAAHSNVFVPGSTAWWNIYNVMTGGEVSLDSEPGLRLQGTGDAARYVFMDPVDDSTFNPPTAPVR